MLPQTPPKHALDDWVTFVWHGGGGLGTPYLVGNDASIITDTKINRTRIVAGSITEHKMQFEDAGGAGVDHAKNELNVRYHTCRVAHS